MPSSSSIKTKFVLREFFKTFNTPKDKRAIYDASYLKFVNTKQKDLKSFLASLLIYPKTLALCIIFMEEYQALQEFGNNNKPKMIINHDDGWNQLWEWHAHQVSKFKNIEEYDAFVKSEFDNNPQFGHRAVPRAVPKQEFMDMTSISAALDAFDDEHG